MAFGTWLKKAFTKVKDFAVNKALPMAKKVAGFVGKAAAPVLGAVGSVIGGPHGNLVSGIGEKISGYANDFGEKMNMIGSGGAGRLRPLLKLE